MELSHAYRNQGFFTCFRLVDWSVGLDISDRLNYIPDWCSVEMNNIMRCLNACRPNVDQKE